MQKLYIHIGLPKTGTTAIQDFCKEKRRLLAEYGLYYPHVQDDDYGHSHLSYMRYGNKVGLDGIQNNIKAILNEIKISGVNKALISEEIFYSHPCEDFFELTNNFETKFIVYLRSPFLLEHSAMLFEAFSFMRDSRSPIGPSPLGISSRTQDPLFRSYGTYMQLKLNWLDTNDIDDFIFIDYDNESKSGTLIKSLFDKIGISMPKNYATKNANPSLGADNALFLGQSQLIPMRWTDRHELYYNLIELSRRKKESLDFRFISDEEIEAVPAHIKTFFASFGKYIGQNDFFNRGIEKLRQRPFIPYRNLPVARQHAIFAQLDEPVRNTIAEFKNGALTASIPIFPNFPETEQALSILESWHGALNAATRD